MLGKPPALSPRSSAPRGDREPLVIEAGATICAQAIVFAGALDRRRRDRRRPGVRARARARRRRHRGRPRRRRSTTTSSIGERVRLQSNVYLTAFSRHRGRRLRRALRDDDERRHDGAPRAGRPDARARALRRACRDRRRRGARCRASRSARRPSSPPARSSRATSPSRKVVVGRPGARSCARCPRTTCSNGGDERSRPRAALQARDLRARGRRARPDGRRVLGWRDRAHLAARVDPAAGHRASGSSTVGIGHGARDGGRRDRRLRGRHAARARAAQHAGLVT